MGQPMTKPPPSVFYTNGNSGSTEAANYLDLDSQATAPARGNVIHAIRDYEAKDNDEISIRKHNTMHLLDNSDDVWCLVELEQSKERGYVPYNHIAAGPPKTVELASDPSADSNQVEDSQPECSTDKCTLTQNADQLNENRLSSSGSNTVVAMYDFKARAHDDLSFNKHDRMVLIDGSDSDWWYVKHSTNGEQGFVPSNYVTIDDSLTRFEWFVRISRIEAARLISRDLNPQGTFLIRESESEPGTYALAFKYRPSGKKDGPQVHHLKISRDSTAESYYLDVNEKFPSIEALVKNYTMRPGVLPCRLTKICPKPLPATHGLAHQLKDDWEIDRDALVLQEELGSGNYGQVHQGLWNNTTPVAIKTLKPGSMSPEAFLLEAKVMKECKHPNLVQLFAVCTKKEPIFIVTELMCNGSLRDYLLKKKPNTFSWDLRLDVAIQVANGMDYLAGKHLVHRDLAARNVLVGDLDQCKIGDFGMARLVAEGDYLSKTGIEFPVKWTAPEAITHKIFSLKSDVWSFGILLIEIGTLGGVPYPGFTNYEVMDLIKDGRRHSQPYQCPSEIYNIMQLCWHIDPQERPSFTEIFLNLKDLVGAYPA